MGGSTLGFRDAGFGVVGAIENDKTAANTLLENHLSVAVVTDDISNVSSTECREQLQLNRSELTLLMACPPCQGFLSPGSRDSDDKRNGLVVEVWCFAAEMQPSAILVENVPGLVRDPR